MTDYEHQFIGLCIGFGADPECIWCRKTYSEIEHSSKWSCDEHEEYMKIVSRVRKK